MESGWYQTCNIAYPRALLEQLGGFDERFGQLGEDADVGLRAAAAGARTTFASDALVWHAVIPRGLQAALREAGRRDTLPLLIARHPRQRERLFVGVFWKRSHATLPLAALAVIAARRRPLAIAGVVPYLMHNVDLERVRSPRRALRAASSLATQGLVDAVEIVATMRGAARSGTLVL